MSPMHETAVGLQNADLNRFSFRDALSKACRMDLFSACYAWSSEEINCLQAYRHQLRRKPGFLRRIRSFFVEMTRALFHAVVTRRQAVPPGRIVFMSWSFNQKQSLAPIASHLDDSLLIFEPGSKNNVMGVSVLLATLLALPFFWRLPTLIRRASPYQKTVLQYWLQDYWLSMGYYLAAFIWLRRTRPSMVVVANDHVMAPRMLTQAAQDLQIPTVYVQHASVTSLWPPLSFDYALLEGVDALEKYTQAGPSETRVFLVGSPKLDPLCQNRRAGNELKSIVLCISVIDSEERVEELIEGLAIPLAGIRMCLRPHPADVVRWSSWRNMATRYGMRFSDSNSEPITDLLRYTDVVIAGNSSVLLEAAVANVHPIYYCFSGTRNDFYGYVRHGLTECCTDCAQVIACLEGLQSCRPDVRARARRYCHTIHTVHDGQSATLCATLLRTITSGLRPEDGNWQAFDYPGMKVYEPATG